MADRLEAFTVTVPAGVVPGAPQVTNLLFNDGTIDEIEIVVPRGPSGLVGFRLSYGGQQIIPNTVGQWLITNDEKINWRIDNLPTGAQWQVTAYNNDLYSHNLYLRFLVDSVGVVDAGFGVSPALAIPAVPASQLAAPSTDSLDFSQVLANSGNVAS